MTVFLANHGEETGKPVTLMSHEWERVAAIFDAALDREPDDRAPFVREACANEPEVCRQVEALLAEVDRPAVVDQPIGDAIAELLEDETAVAVGALLGPYRVESLLGVGGMGEVYRATDTVLARQVAIKILPQYLSADAERLARFRREARILASLNHPNIGHIYGLETLDATAGGTFGLVLELVEGPTLAEKLAAGRLPVAEALAIARQIAEAIEAAHEQGVVHRDLKPANIKVREDGVVKVLDFGLARASRDAVEDATAGSLSGTAAYMSPEQAKGKAADKRSDIWAFGCVLYEMLTGTQPFAGTGLTEVLATVLTTEPDWTSLPAGLSPTLNVYLRRCLHKEPKQRVADFQDVRLALDGAFETASTATTASIRTSWSWSGWLAGAALFGGISVGAVLWLTTRPPQPRVTRFALSPTGTAALAEASATRDVTVLPDGGRVVYRGNGARGASQLFVRALDSLEPTLLVRDGIPAAPFSSPDGRWVGYIDTENPAPVVKKVAVAGGPVVTLASLDGQGSGATWGDDGSIIVATANLSTGLQRVPSEGGEPEVLTRPDREHGERDHVWPQYLPGSQAVLFTVQSTTGDPEASQIAVLDLRTGARKIVLPGASQAQYARSGHLVYVSAGSLRAVPFDTRRLEVLGKSTPVVSEVATTPSGMAEFDIARDGTLAYVPRGRAASPARTLVWVDRHGREELVKGAEARAYVYPRLSPTGDRLALDVRDQENDIWVWDFARETLTRVTFDPGLDRAPVWMPDGRRIVFSSQSGSARNIGAGALFWRAADGTGTAERLGQQDRVMLPTSVSPDGARVVTFGGSDSLVTFDVMALTMNDRRVQPLVQTPFNERNGEVSPDGRWLAYESNASGQFQIYVRPFPGVEGGQWLVSTAGGTQPLWARSGQELFYITPDGALNSVRVGRGARWVAGSPQRILEAHYFVGAANYPGRTYDVSADGLRFLRIKESDPERTAAPGSIVVVQNWLEELKRLVATN